MGPIDTYTEIQFLVDETNIRNKLYATFQGIDLAEWDKLASESFMPDVSVDYSKVFGTEPEVIPGHVLMSQWKPRVEGLDASQHVLSTLHIELPQPGCSIPHAVRSSANGIVHMQKVSGTIGEKTFHIGVRYDFEMQRTEAGTGNPWRIRHIGCVTLWASGNEWLMRGNAPK